MLTQKFWGSSPNIFYGLEAYGIHQAGGCLRISDIFISNFKTNVCFLSMAVQLYVAYNPIN